MKKKDDNLQHDGFCRSMLSNIKLLISFLRFVLSRRMISMLDLDTLELVKESHFDKDLKEFRSDILVKAYFKKKYREKNNGEPLRIFFLIEHKSYKKRYVLFQILQYLVLIWRVDVMNSKDLTLTIPILIYHGEGKWDRKKRFKMCFSKFLADIFSRFIPDFDYKVVNLPDLNLNKIRDLKLYLFVSLLGNSHRNIGNAFKESIIHIDREAKDGDIDDEFRQILERSVKYVSRSTHFLHQKKYLTLLEH